jgi:6-phospho-beta-glucosidase
VTQALLANPLVGHYDQATWLADRMIAENAGFLPWATGDEASPAPFSGQ